MYIISTDPLSKSQYSCPTCTCAPTTAKADVCSVFISVQRAPSTDACTSPNNTDVKEFSGKQVQDQTVT